MLRVTLRSLLARKARLLLSTLAIVIGVAAVSGSLILTDTLRAAFLDLFASIGEGVAVTVRGEAAVEGLGAETPPVPESVLAQVREVDGVAEAYGATSGYAAVVGSDGEVVGGGGPPTLGVDWTPSETMNALTIVEGRQPQTPTEVVVDVVTAENGELAVGEPVRVVLRSGVQTFTLVGTARFGSAGNLAGATLAVFEPATAQALVGTPGAYTAVDVAAEPGVSEDALAENVRAVLPDGFEALTRTEVADEGAAQISEGLGFFGTALLVFAGIALFVGAFLIHNTFAILVGQRTRELALMRILGARRGQVLRTVVVEAAFVGLVASIVGFGMGMAVAAGLKAMLASFGIELPSIGLQVKAPTLVWSLVVGVGVSVVAALGPARHAAATAPMAALRLAAAPPRPAWGRRTAVGGGLLALGIGLLTLGLTRGPFALTGLGAVTGFVGLAALSPLLVPPMAALIAAPVSRWVPGRLGRANTVRTPTRTANTASALMVGLAFVTAAGTFGSSLKASVADTLEASLGADFILLSQGFQGFSPALAPAIAEQPGVAYASPQRVAFVEISDPDGSRPGGTERGPEGGAQSETVSGVDPSTVGEAAGLDISSGSLEDLGAGGLGVSDSVAESWGVGVGDPLVVTFSASGPQTLPVVVTYADNQLVGGYSVSLTVFEANSPQALDQLVFVGASEGATDADLAALRDSLDTLTADYPDVTVQDRSELIASQQDQVNQLVNIVYVLLALAVVISLLGIVNTLALSSLERTSEIGMLRAVGMSRRQVRGMIRTESVIIAVLGAALGMAAGTAIGWAIVRSLADEGIETFAMPWGTLGIFVVVAVLAGVLAAALPARRAANIRITEAIAAE